jgi:hypothetical protein
MGSYPFSPDERKRNIRRVRFNHMNSERDYLEKVYFQEESLFSIKRKEELGKK